MNLNRISAPTTQRRQLIDFLKGCRARLTPTQVGLPDTNRRRTPGLAPGGRRGPGRRQRHLVHLARAGARHSGFGRRARAHFEHAAHVARRARVSVRARAASAGAADLGTRGRCQPGDYPDARLVGCAGDRADGALGCHRLESTRAQGHPRLQRPAAGAAQLAAHPARRGRGVSAGSRCSTKRRRDGFSRSFVSTTAKHPAIPRSRS